MSPFEIVAILLAGVAAGTINTVVGSGTLITFPTLLAFGIPPVTANVSNAIGLVPGSITGAWGYRRELEGQRPRVLRLGIGTLAGAVVGAVLLLTLPPGAFKAIVPVLIALSLVLVVAQPRITRWVAVRHDHAPPHQAAWVWPAILLTGIYCGYFGAAQGILLMAIMGIGIQESLQRLNGIKNILAAIGNGVAGLIFVFVADVDWRVVGLIAVGSVVGGVLGARIGRRLPPVVLRGVIVAVGAIALAVLVLR